MSDSSKRETPATGALELSFTLVALVVGFAALGFFVDRWLHTGPWLMVTGVFVGAVLGFGYMVYILFAGRSGRRRKGGAKDGAEGADKGSS